MAYLPEARAYQNFIADFQRQSLSADDLSSGNDHDLLVDSDEILLDAENEKDDVAEISPDSDTDVDRPRPILANDRTFQSLYSCHAGGNVGLIGCGYIQTMRFVISSLHL